MNLPIPLSKDEYKQRWKKEIEPFLLDYFIKDLKLMIDQYIGVKDYEIFPSILIFYYEDYSSQIFSVYLSMFSTYNDLKNILFNDFKYLLHGYYFNMEINLNKLNYFLNLTDIDKLYIKLTKK